MAGGAARATAAARDEAEHHVVAGREPADTRADLLHDAGALMAADDRQLERQVAGDQVLVAVAHARCGQLDQHLARAWWIELDLFDAPRRVDLPQNGSFRLHVQTPRVSVRRRVERYNPAESVTAWAMLNVRLVVPPDLYDQVERVLHAAPLINQVTLLDRGAASQRAPGDLRSADRSARIPCSGSCGPSDWRRRVRS